MLDSSQTSDVTFQGEVFEGPEKKLEVFLTTSASDAEGLRQFGQSTWSELLVAASCSILHCKANNQFDAYLLSESSMFVFANKVILKTCGTTGLLLVLPKLLTLAESIGAVVESVHYGRYRYKFPEQQLYPHASFDQEHSYLSQFFNTVHSRILGPAEGRCWFVLSARTQQPLTKNQLALPEAAMAPASAPPVSPLSGDDIFEIAMEGLSMDFCQRFFESTYPHFSGRALAAHMTAVSGIGSLLPDVDVDDWAFEPCGYSMNGLRGAFYYTIHITPEEGFSYASFETNDPKYRQPSWVHAVVSTFLPTVFTATLTTRRIQCELPSYKPVGFERTCMDLCELGAGVSVCSMNFSADRSNGRKRRHASPPAKQVDRVQTEPMTSAEGCDSVPNAVVATVKMGTMLVVA